MLTTVDAPIAREVLGDAVYSVEDAELMTPIRVELTGLILLDVVPGADTETDPGRLTMILAAHAYLIGIDVLSADIGITDSKLADSTLTFGEDRDRILAYWRQRYHNLVRRLSGTPMTSANLIVLGHGGRG